MGTTLGNNIKDKKRALVQKLFNRSVKVMNKEINLQDYQDEYAKNENRSLVVHIEDLGTYGFVIGGGQVRTLHEGDMMTTEMWMTMDEFILIATGEEDLMDAFWAGRVIVDGKNWFRDLGIFSRVSQKNKFLFRRMKE